VSEKCAWAPQNDSQKAWYFPVAHPDDDLQSLSDMRVWNFCPYCGKEIELTQHTSGADK
jgi:hypothetical protein